MKLIKSAEASPIQKRFWLCQDLTDKPEMYTVCESWLITGKFSADLFFAAIDHAVDKHQCLRSTFRNLNGVLYQDIYEGLGVYKSHRAYKPSDKELNEMSALVFNIAKKPIVKIVIYAEDVDVNRVVLIIPHIICDVWALKILLGEISKVYNSLFVGNKSYVSSDGTSLTYASYSNFYNKYIKSKEYKAKLNNFVNYLLKHNCTRIFLPYKDTNSIRSDSGKRVCFSLNSKIINGLNKMAKSSRCSLYILMLSAYQILLYKYSGQDKFFICTPFANRSTVEHQKIFGPFLNTTVLPVCVDGTLNARKYFSYVKDNSFTAFKYQDCLYDDVIRVLNDFAAEPHKLFQVFFNFLEASFFELNLIGANSCNIEMRPDAVMFDLSLQVRVDQNQIKGYFEYKDKCFDEEIIKQLSNHYLSLLENMVDYPSSKINDLQMMSSEELELLLS